MMDMTKTAQSKGRQSRQRLSAVVVLSLIALQAFVVPVQAESLFRASTSYNAQEPLRPRSLFTPPISREVGDLVTILIEESTTQETAAELKITRNQAISDTGTPLFNGMLGFMLDKIPFMNGGRLQRTLSAPSFDGLNNTNNLGSKAESSRTTTLRDQISCQVVQVLPNGDLVVQGQKTVQVNKERGDLMVTGIIRPYYLNRFNEIPSNRVANFQMLQGGKGVISRQQNDGIANKIYQFFN